MRLPHKIHHTHTYIYKKIACTHRKSWKVKYAKHSELCIESFVWTKQWNETQSKTWAIIDGKISRCAVMHFHKFFGAVCLVDMQYFPSPLYLLHNVIGLLKLIFDFDPRGFHGADKVKRVWCGSFQLHWLLPICQVWSMCVFFFIYSVVGYCRHHCTVGI